MWEHGVGGTSREDCGSEVFSHSGGGVGVGGHAHGAPGAVPCGAAGTTLGVVGHVCHGGSDEGHPQPVFTMLSLMATLWGLRRTLSGLWSRMWAQTVATPGCATEAAHTALTSVCAHAPHAALRRGGVVDSVQHCTCGCLCWAHPSTGSLVGAVRTVVTRQQTRRVTGLVCVRWFRGTIGRGGVHAHFCWWVRRSVVCGCAGGWGWRGRSL